ncbi:hypothetical protein MTO96_035104 [Rhipicephalus appendiculatus]
MYPAAVSALINGKIDVIVMKTNLEHDAITLMSYGDVDVAYNTFYARANDTRTVSVFDVLSYSTVGVSLTVISILVCALVLAALNGTRSFATLALSFTHEGNVPFWLLYSQLPCRRRHIWHTKEAVACYTFCGSFAFSPCPYTSAAK